jgi:hypothetical protein
MSELRARQLMNIVQLQTAVENMHKQVRALATKARNARVALHHAHNGVRPVNFAVGDYVLRGVLTRERGCKADVCWKGRYVVLQAQSDNLFEVCHLLKGDKQVVHGTRLKFFRNASWTVSEEAKEHLAYLEDELCVVDHFVDLRKRTETCELKVYWKGFEERDSTWEPFADMKEDVPDTLRDFLLDLTRTGTPAKKKLAASLLE